MRCCGSKAGLDPTRAKQRRRKFAEVRTEIHLCFSVSKSRDALLDSIAIVSRYGEASRSRTRQVVVVTVSSFSAQRELGWEMTSALFESAGMRCAMSGLQVARTRGMSTFSGAGRVRG